MKYLKNYPSFLLRKFKTKKISFSQTGLDLLLSNIFKGLQKGFYVDIGCNHPVYNNNTFLYQQNVCTILFTIIFGNFAKIPTDGLPPFIFYLSGNVIWSYFSFCLAQISNTFNKYSELEKII